LAKDKETGLTEKQRLFAIKYIELDFNATQAYVKVYKVSERTAEVNGHKLLRNAKIREYIDKELDNIIGNTKELEKQVIEEYKKIAFANIKDYIDVETGEYIMTEDSETGAVESIQVDSVRTKDGESIEKRKFKLHDKIKALDSLAKLVIGMTEKHRLVDENGDDKELNITIEVINEKGN